MSSNRRTFLVAAGSGAAAALAGCLGGGDSGDGSGGSGGQGTLSAPVMGPADADVVVKTWEDFRCPHCKHFHLEVLPKVESEYVQSGTARVERHDFPIPIDQLSWTTAVAARSVQANEGVETFWKFTERAYERQSQLSIGAIREVAAAVGADGERVASDAESGEYRPVVEDDRQAGREKGVSATPSVFVDGESVSNTYQAVASAIEDAT